MLPTNIVRTVYTTDYREAPDRSRTATGPNTDESCDHERTVYVEGESGGSLTCQDCGTTMPAESGDQRPEEGGIAASCRWVLTRVGGRY